jgi:phenylpropionate dioxygenase-like ring-hydroxylating dioxygenase large terminal subunit
MLPYPDKPNKMRNVSCLHLFLWQPNLKKNNWEETMLSAEINELITRTGPDTSCGNLLRQYWQPAALTVELEGERPVRQVELFGEKLVLFKDEKGRYGLMDRRCPHRGVDLCYGRAEHGGLRCPFHGWLFDVSGQCLEMPGEPVDTKMPEKIKNTAYPCMERNGIIFTFMGKGNPPPLPEYDCLTAPAEFTFAFKGRMECNWLQALEVGIDPVHASFLHRYLEDESLEGAYGKQFRGAASKTDIPVTKVLREYARPTINVDETDSGLRLTTTRDLPDDARHVRVTNLVFPLAITIPMGSDMTITQWHVPVDDENSYWYAVFTDYTKPVDQALMRQQRENLYEMPDYIPKINKSNNYRFDVNEQKTRTYLGMGDDINVHDQWAVESPGPIYDRTREHLATSDKAIIAYRRMLRRAIAAAQKGEALPALPNGKSPNLKGPVAVDTIGTIENWNDVWKQVDKERRSVSPWAKDPW